MSQRMPIVGGNWKMNTDLASAVELADNVAAGCAGLIEHCDIVLFPPFPYLQSVGKTLGNHGLLLGAQDLSDQPNGALTGEVSAEMLLDLHVSVVLVGHSERRHVIGEDDELIAAKLVAALDSGLWAILCVGETLEQREADQTREVIVGQVASALGETPAEQLRQLVIAYEPVWAIGTGRTATAEQAQSVHAIIRRTLGDLYDESNATEVRVQYGGSVKSSNAATLFAEEDIDGGLIGGASLNADDFVTICQAAVDAG